MKPTCNLYSINFLNLLLSADSYGNSEVFEMYYTSEKASKEAEAKYLEKGQSTIEQGVRTSDLSLIATYTSNTAPLLRESESLISTDNRTQTLTNLYRSIRALQDSEEATYDELLIVVNFMNYAM